MNQLKIQGGFDSPGQAVCLDDCLVKDSKESNALGFSPRDAYMDSGGPFELSHITPRSVQAFADWRETMDRYWNAVDLRCSWVRSVSWSATAWDSNIGQDGDFAANTPTRKQSFREVEYEDLVPEQGIEGSLEPCHFGDGAFPLHWEETNQHRESVDGGCRSSGVNTWDTCLANASLMQHALSDLSPGSGRRANSDPSWLTWKQDSHSRHLPLVCSDQRDRQRQRSKRAVWFADQVELSCFIGEQVLHATLRMEDWQRCCRSLWHLHGQIPEISMFPQVVAAFHRDDRMNEAGMARQEPAVVLHGDTDLLPDSRGIFNDLQREDERPKFADTWFLAEDRFPLCVKPRKLKLERQMWESGEVLHQKCRLLWKDLDDGSSISLRVVTKAPNRLPAFQFHIVIIQGSLRNSDWTLFHSALSPVFYRYRAVLFPSGCTVRDFFRCAQVGADCMSGSSTCYLRHTDSEGSTYWHNDERFSGTSTHFIEGDIRFLHDSEDEGEISDDDVAGRSTSCPSDEDEMSLMQSTEPNIQFQFDDDGAYPWMNMGLEDPDDAVLDQEEPDQQPNHVTLAEGHWDHILEEIDHLTADEETEDKCWTAVTYGLSLVDLGRRDAEFQKDSMQSLIDAITEAWRDHLAFGDITVYVVNPQPTNVIGSKSIAMLVIFSTLEELDDSMKYILVIEEAVEDVGSRPEPYAASIVNEITDRQVLFHLDLHHHCPPFALRPYYVRMGVAMMVHGQRYNIDHGTLCKTWIGHIHEQVTAAEQYISDAETFFLQVQSFHELRGPRETVVCRVHGITPENRPMGHRDVIIPAEWIYDLDWIHQMQRLWPFQNENIALHFVVHATADMREEPHVVFHFIANCGIGNGVPVLVNQQLISVDAMQHDPQGCDEFWAVCVPEGEIGINIVGALHGSPFWFSFARSNHIRPHMLVNGRRILEVHAHWKSGDVIRARFLVWQRHHMLQILLGSSQDAQQENVEHTSFLQTKVQRQRAGGAVCDDVEDSFTETCFHLLDDAAVVRQQECDVEKIETIQYEPEHSDRGTMHGGGVNLDPTWCFGHDQQSDASLGRLNIALAQVCLPGWKGLNHDMMVLDDLHPHAKLACQLTRQDEHAGGTFHVFTDGSCKNGRAGWSFAVVCAQQCEGYVRFVRIGYAAGELNSEIGPVAITAQDAEATAIVAACEYLLSRRSAQQIAVHMHFDAWAVGFGSTGVSNVVRQEPKVSQRQRAARILVSLVQRNNALFRGCHVHAHEGHPWNELVDSLAKLAAMGWLPNIPARFRSGDLLAHPLAEWAWIQLCPDQELPCLEQIIGNEVPKPCDAKLDSTFTTVVGEDDTRWYATLHFASINVGTLHQDQMLPHHTVTYKAAELMHQFASANLHFVGVQEARAKESCSKRYGDFTCLVSAGERGQAGVELWINERAVNDALGFDFSVDKDVGVWHATPRILAATCHLGHQPVNLVVAYAPQRGNGHDVVARWWSDLTQVLTQCSHQYPIFVMGDFNCSIGTS